MGIYIAVVSQQLALGRFHVWRVDPLAGHDARECDADARGTVQPAWTRPAGQLLADIAGKVVAVAGEDVVGGTVKFERGAVDDGVDLGLGREREALQDLGSKRAARGFGLWLGPVHARHTSPVMPPIRVFLAVDHDAGVEEGCAEGP